MNRQQLEHIIRAAADISDDDEIVIVGSQAILGQFPTAIAHSYQEARVELVLRSPDGILVRDEIVDRDDEQT